MLIIGETMHMWDLGIDGKFLYLLNFSVNLTASKSKVYCFLMDKECEKIFL